MRPIEAAVVERVKRRLPPQRAAWYERHWTEKRPASGVGASLLALARELGAGGLGCGCRRIAEQMNAWGIDGCLTHQPTIAAALGELAAIVLQRETPDWLDRADAVNSLLYRAIWLAENETLASKRPAFVTTEQLVADTYRLASLLPPEVAGIVGVARSGILPANLLCQHLHLPMWILRQDSNSAQPRDWGAGDVIPTGNGWRLHDRPASRGKPLMAIVDDTQMTGRSIRRARPLAEAWARQHGYELLWAAIYQNPLVKPRDRADLVARALPRPHFLEWNFFNSHLLAHAAFDLDGILCDEHFRGKGSPPARYPARKSALPLIATGRHERHRGATLAWLARWGIRCARLEMLPNGRDNRDPEICAAHKAGHFAASGLSWFVESCPVQARRIAELTGKPVLCPAAAAVY